MEKIENLIITLKQCIPALDTAPLQSEKPLNDEQFTLLEWLYKHLSAQNLMVYEEWKEYTGDIPALKALSDLSMPEAPADFIFSAIEKIDWSTASIDPYEIAYFVPWLEHINFYLKPHALRLITLLPFENAYIFCVRDDEVLLQKLEASLQAFDMGIHDRQPMDQQQVLADIEQLISE